MARLSVRIDPRLKARLEAAARARRVSPSVVVRDALQKHLAEPEPGESALDLALRIGIVGCIKGLPPDLSTNPKYMEGFGRE
jgi:metal-responsive CopG/Arc/MetJ family transcriptional regulator